MAANDKTLAVWQRGLLYVGVEDATPATPLGYIGREQGLALSLPKDVERYFFDTLDGPGIIKTVTRGAMIKGTCIQFEAGVLDHVLGIDDAANIFKIGGTSCTDKRFSASIVATRRDAALVTATMLHAVSVGSLETIISANGLSELPFEFEGEDEDTDGCCQIEIGSTETVTLSTGVATVSASEKYVFLLGEESTTDTLTSISQSEATTGDQLVLQISSESAPITLTHATGSNQPNLTGGVDWIMADLDDVLIVQHDGTGWAEIARFDAIH